MSITVIKTSKRTMRSTCDRCKVEGDYYWAQVEETGARVLLDQGPLNEGIEHTGKAVPTRTVHHCFRKQIGLDENGYPLPVSHPVSVPSVPAVEPAPVTPAPAPASEPVAPTGFPASPVAPAPADQSAQMTKLFGMMAELFGAQIDMGELLTKVQEMVNAEVDRIAHPVNTVVTNAATGTTKTVTGAHMQLASVIGALQDGHVYLVGPAGTGKSHMAEDAAEALETTFWTISVTQQTPVSALAGYMTATGEYVRTGFRDAVEFGHVALIDEIDHGHPNTIGFMNAATSNRTVGFPDGTVKVHPNFRCIAAGNTFGTGQNSLHTGATKLDAATLNRYGKLEIGYDESLENSMVSATGIESATQRKVLEFVRKVRRNALKHPEFQVVASPRNSVRIAKALKRGELFDAAIEMHLMAGISADKRVKLTA